MDFRRSIIFIGLAVVSYMLVLAWNEDYGQASQLAASKQTSQQSNLPSLSESSTENRSTNTTTNDEFTVPEAKNNAIVESNTQAQNTESSLISVRTDVLDLQIDLKGGNIISAKLPEYKVALGSDQSLSLLESSRERYYVVESGLFGKNGFDSSRNGPVPTYSASSTSFELGDGNEELVVSLKFAGSNNVGVTKQYTFTRDSYLIDVTYIIDNQSENEFEANLSGKIVRDKSPDPSSQNSMGMQSFLGMALSSAEKPYEKYDFEDMLEEPINEQIYGGWVAFIQHYFLSAWVPDKNTTHTYQSKIRNGRYLMGFISPATYVAAGQSGSVSAKVYIGPKIMDRLERTAANLDLAVDYGWLFWVATPLFLLLDFLYGLVQNWGIAIILVTVVVKAVFFHLSAASYRSMANMRRVAPKLQALKEQYGDDRQKMSQAMMDLYRKEKINPLGGCLPILVQMPVFIALYWVLLESVQLRHAPFMLWIDDLSVMDPYFILPILMGASMFIQMQLNPAPPDPMQAKIMKFMPIVMTVFFLWFPSGLVLYWLVNNILSIAQQWVITRQIENAHSKS